MGHEFGGSATGAHGGGAAGAHAGSGYLHYHSQNASLHQQGQREAGPSPSPRLQAYSFRWITGFVSIIFSLISYLQYRETIVELGINDTRLIYQPWHLFVKSIKVADSAGDAEGPAFYTFDDALPMRRVSWTEHHNNVLMQPFTYHGWAFWLHKLSDVQVHYNVSDGAFLSLTVLRGADQNEDWLRQPFNYDGDWAYKEKIAGEGSTRFHASEEAETYYFAFTNGGHETVFSIQFDIQAAEFDVTMAKSKCDIGANPDSCTVAMPLLSFSRQLAYVIGAPNSTETGKSWFVSIHYQPRYLGYALFIGLVILLSFGITEVWLYRVEQKQQARAGQLPTDSRQNNTPAEGVLEVTPLVPKDTQRETEFQTLHQFPEENPSLASTADIAVEEEASAEANSDAVDAWLLSGKV